MKNEGAGEEVLLKYREHILSSPELVAALPELEGKTLGCYYHPKRLDNECKEYEVQFKDIDSVE